MVAYANLDCYREVKQKFLQEIAASDDLARTATLHNRLLKVAKGVLDKGEARFDTVVTMLRGDVTEHLLSAMEKYAESACWDNFSLLEPLVKQLSWLSEEAVAIYKIQSEKVRHAQGGSGAELKLKELLELAKFSGWTSAKRVAARALGGLNR